MANIAGVFSGWRFRIMYNRVRWPDNKLASIGIWDSKESWAMNFPWLEYFHMNRILLGRHGLHRNSKF